MKKALLVLLAAVGTMAFAACGNSDEPVQAVDTQNETVTAAANVATTTPEAQTAPATQNATETQLDLRADVDLAPAFANLASEAAHRLNATPLRVFPLLADSITNGTVNVDVRYGGPFGIRVEANMATNSQTQQHHTQLGVNYMGFVRIDAEVFATPDSLAIRVPIFDDNFYGVTFSTLEYDLPEFLSIFGIELDDLAEIFDGLDMVLDGLQLDADPEDWLETLLPYVDVIVDFIDDFNVTAQNTQRDGVAVTRYEYSFTFDQLYTMVENLYDVVQADTDTLQYLAMMDITMRDISEMFNEILTSLEIYYRAIRRDMENSSVALALYVSQDDRLMYMELQLYSAQVETVSQKNTVSMDFGASVYCDWVLAFTTAIDGRINNGTDTLIWSFSDIGGTYTNTITFAMYDLRSGGYDMAGVSSVWSTTTGDFALSVYDDFGSLLALNGQLAVNANGGFELRFEEGELEIIVSGTPGAPSIPQVNIVNMDQWDIGLVEDVMDFVFELAMMLE